MFKYLRMSIYSFVLFSCLFLNSADGKTMEEKPKLEARYLEQVSTQFCPSKKQVNYDCFKKSYEEEIQNGLYRSDHLHYALLLPYLAQTDQERQEALFLEQEAIFKLFYFFGSSYYNLSTMANLISAHYSYGHLSPTNLKKAQKWTRISQSYKEAYLYRCKNRKQKKCRLPDGKKLKN